MLIIFRVWMLNAQLPIFSRQDNPTAFESSKLTQLLSYAHLVICNLRLLFCPTQLSYDWQMHSIPLVQTLADARNLLSLTLVLLLLPVSRLVLTSLFATNRTFNCQTVRWSFALLVAGLSFLPASNLLVTVGFVLAERTLYLPR